jgi:hypothetical protein
MVLIREKRVMIGNDTITGTGGSDYETKAAFFAQVFGSACHRRLTQKRK